VMGNERDYGAKAVIQLGEYLDIDPTLLYAYKNLAEGFEKGFLEAWSIKPMRNGKQYLTVSHWMAIRLIKDQADQERFLKKALAGDLTANQLKELVAAGGEAKKNKRSGGRKPARPTSVTGGLQRFTSRIQTVVNLRETIEETVRDPLSEISPGDVDDNLLVKLETLSQITDAGLETLTGTQKWVGKSLDRVKKILAQRPKAQDNGQAAAAAKPAAKKAGKKGKKGGKKKAAKKAAPAAAATA
jgi:hypothetical protein